MTSFSISGIGMDSSITPLRHGGLSLVQTTDFFYPLVEDPYMQGNFYFILFKSELQLKVRPVMSLTFQLSEDPNTLQIPNQTLFYILIISFQLKLIEKVFQNLKKFLVLRRVEPPQLRRIRPNRQFLKTLLINTN